MNELQMIKIFENADDSTKIFIGILFTTCFVGCGLFLIFDWTYRKFFKKDI